MQQSLAEMQLALRVLTALTQRKPPKSEDIEELRRIAPPESKEFALDELACSVIQGALEHRSKARQAEGKQPAR